MFQLSDRVAALRDDAVNKKSYMKYFSVQRSVYFKLGVYEAKKQNLTNTEIVSQGLVNTIKKFTPYIIPGELIVGFNYGDAETGLG